MRRGDCFLGKGQGILLKVEVCHEEQFVSSSDSSRYRMIGDIGLLARYLGFGSRISL